MDEKMLEDIRNWEHPPWYGTTQFEEKVKEIFWENQKGLHFPPLQDSYPDAGEARYLVHFRTSHTAITLNPESNCARREKKHFLFHWNNTLTSPQLLRQTWMLCKKAASMIIGTLMDQETCLILGQVFTQLTLFSEKPPEDICGREGDWQNVKRSGVEWQRTLSWGRSRNEQLKNQSSIMRQDYEESISLTLRTWRSRKSFKMQEKIGNTNGSSHALQDLQEKQAWRDQ